MPDKADKMMAVLSMGTHIEINQSGVFTNIAYHWSFDYNALV